MMDFTTGATTNDAAMGRGLLAAQVQWMEQQKQPQQQPIRHHSYCMPKTKLLF